MVAWVAGRSAHSFFLPISNPQRCSASTLSPNNFSRLSVLMGLLDACRSAVEQTGHNNNCISSHEVGAPGDTNTRQYGIRNVGPTAGGLPGTITI